MDITSCPMTRELCRKYYEHFEVDPSIYMDMSLFKPYAYSDERADAYFERQLSKGRVFLAVIAEDAPVGEIIFKDMDAENGECTLSIHLQNDSVKGRGIGTAAERLALKYAFSELGMKAVNADTVLKNERSRHVLEKVGFRYVRSEGQFHYFRCTAEEYAEGV